METSDWISLTAAIISLIAIALSGIAIWKTHFVRFSPILSIGSCRHRIYPIKSDNERWYISSFDIPISFTNQGAQAGRIDDIRVKITFPKLPIDGHYEMFYPKWDVNGKELSQNRFSWIKTSVKEDWMPFIVLPKETKNKHLVFETRWDEPVIQESVECELQIRFDGKKEWKEISQWKIRLTKQVWYDMAENGVSYGTSPDLKMDKKDFIHPEDLHKYTGTKEPIENERKKSGPSYLDYKEKE
jgi:hypothetical protein